MKKTSSSVFCLPSSVSEARADLSSSVLIAVTGMSPAILTETAWALAHERSKILPNKVVVFATTRSRDQIRRELLESGVWEQLRSTLRAKPDELVFSDAGDHIRVFTRLGRELEDLRTPADNAAAADFILEHLRSFTENPEQRIIASIAGGRKTMGALLYACMSLIGRETDRITHVLVDEALESRRDPKFFFPQTSDEEKKINLADVPFVPLRNRVVEIGRLPGTFTRLIQAYSRQLAEDAATATVSFDDRNCRVTIDGTTIELRKRAYVVLRYLVHLNKSGKKLDGIDISADEFKAFVQKLNLVPEWLTNVEVKDDIKRELSHIRKKFIHKGISWMPGQRKKALHLPPFKLVTS